MILSVYIAATICFDASFGGPSDSQEDAEGADHTTEPSEQQEI